MGVLLGNHLNFGSHRWNSVQLCLLIRSGKFLTSVAAWMGEHSEPRFSSARDCRDTWLHYYHSLSKTLQNPRVAFGYYNISDPDTPKLPKAFKIQHTLFSWPKVFYFTLSEGPCNPCCWDLSRTLAVSASCDRSQSICANISISTDSPTGHLRSSGISANI